ncbi:hypothetical protein [Streptomyces sp. NPDC086519]|uniref:hypothetical protein n=1 Tax=Streptomyces sp. NPDC086519 TaxID=3154863 RepID=UPI0034294BAD
MESDVEGEITDHLAMTSTTRQARTGATPRNGKRAKTLLTEIGPLELLSIPHPQRAVAPSVPSGPPVPGRDEGGVRQNDAHRCAIAQP